LTTYTRSEAVQNIYNHTTQSSQNFASNPPITNLTNATPNPCAMILSQTPEQQPDGETGVSQSAPVYPVTKIVRWCFQRGLIRVDATIPNPELIKLGASLG